MHLLIYIFIFQLSRHKLSNIVTIRPRVRPIHYFESIEFYSKIKLLINYFGLIEFSLINCFRDACKLFIYFLVGAYANAIYRSWNLMISKNSWYTLKLGTFPSVNDTEKLARGFVNKQLTTCNAVYWQCHIKLMW